MRFACLVLKLFPRTEHVASLILMPFPFIENVAGTRVIPPSGFQALISAAMACLSQYQDDKSLSEIIDDYEFDRIALFYVVFAIGLVIVFVLFVSFLFNLHKRSGCGSAKGWTSFVSLKLSSVYH